MSRSRVATNIILALLGVIVWLCSALARVENERYLLWIGLCESPPSVSRRQWPTPEAWRLAWNEAWTCLDTKQARTSQLANILYALDIP